MYSNHGKPGSEHRFALTLRCAALGMRRTPGTTLPHRSIRTRAVLRLFRQHPRLWFAAALAVASVMAIGTADHFSQLLQLVQLHTAVAPLAPAPAPLAPALLPLPIAAPASHTHRLLHSLNPLAGLASWYGSVWNGRTTASGETYDESQLTAAHRSLPLGTLVRVTNLHSMHSVIVRINDRGAFAPGRIIDLSSSAARELGMLEQGMAQVKLEVLRKR